MRLQIAEFRLLMGLRIGAALVATVARRPASSRAETIDRVLAVVAGQLITLSDVTAARDLGLEAADGAADPIRAVLSQLIDRELMLAEVDRYAPPEPTAEAVDREVERVRARFPSPDAFDAALARSGIDEQHLRETLRQNLRMAHTSTSDLRPPRIAARRSSTSGWPACGAAATSSISSSRTADAAPGGHSVRRPCLRGRADVLARGYYFGTKRTARSAADRSRRG